LDKETIILKLIAEFNELVDSFVTDEEINFKKYAKENLNPLFKIQPEFNIVNYVKLINQEIEKTTIEFEGALYDKKAQLNYLKWSWQINKLFIPKICDEIIKNNLFSDPEKDAFKEISSDQLSEILFQLEPEMKAPLKEVIDYINDKKPVQEAPKINEYYYWKYGPLKLNKLYNLLLEEDLIEPNENFNKSYLNHNVLPTQKTIWIKKQVSLFALFYLLNNKKNTYYNESIALVSHNLYKKKGSSPSLNSLKSSYASFKSRIHKEYFKNNHNRILQIIKKLELNK